jgi:CHAT domain-containing protein/Tfp pilus assembly protein PilF
MKIYLCLLCLTILVLHQPLYGETNNEETRDDPVQNVFPRIAPPWSGANTAAQAEALNNKALQLSEVGKYAEAEVVYKRALRIFEEKLGPGDGQVAIVLANLGDVCMDTGRYTEAELLYNKALKIKGERFGRDHTSFGISLNQLGLFYSTTGRYAEAESFYKKALEVFERRLEKDHPLIAMGLSNLALLYDTSGRYAEAELMFKRATGIKEKRFGREHRSVAVSLSNLAGLYEKTDRNTEAELLYKRALEIQKKKLAKDHPAVAVTLNNLGSLYARTGRYAEAEPMYKRALEIQEDRLRSEHPSLATSLSNLAGLYEKTGRTAEAELLYKRAIEIKERRLGKEHPSIAVSLSNMALFYATNGRHPESHRLFHRSVAIKKRTKDDVFLLLTERQKLAYVNQNGLEMEAFLSHTLLHMSGANEAVNDTLNAWIQWKGAVLEAQTRYRDAVNYSDNPEIKRKVDELTALRRYMVRLQFSKPEKMAPEDYTKTLIDTERQKETLESELNRISGNFAIASQASRVDVNGLAASLPAGSVYLDFAKIRILDFQKREWKKTCYLVFVLLPKKQPETHFINLGNTEQIDSHITAYLTEVNRLKEGKLPNTLLLDREAKSLYELIIKPIEALLQGRQQLFVSPDGNLNLIPFEVIRLSSGQFLIEKYQLSYLGAGRDIVKFATSAMNGGTSVVMADPDYDMGLNELQRAKNDLGIKETQVRGEISSDVRNIRFTRLPETKQEADAIDSMLRTGFKHKVENYQGVRAFEEVLYSTASPKILHLATHGYFLKQASRQEGDSRGFGIEPNSSPGEIRALNIENPMLRSGIVLSGVNSALKEGRDDGLVSAEKILGLRLNGTELVVLSACETGVGDVQTGEGVFGLKRAFILSGAKSLVMSLWSVPSKETVDLMKDFYGLLSRGRTKSEALHQAKLNIMKQKPNPVYWGAFVLVGSP